MSGRSFKFEKIFSTAEAAAFLRKMADSIESGNVEQMQDLDFALDDIKKLKIGIKRQDELLELKVKVKCGLPEILESAADEQEDEAKPEGVTQYTSLKKKMDKNFKAMGVMLDAGSLPHQTMIATFLEDSKQMVRYPGYGDEFYESYMAACVKFQTLYESGSVEAVREHYGILRTMKKECHSRYK